VLDIEIVPSVTEHRFYPNNAGKYEIPDCHNSAGCPPVWRRRCVQRSNPGVHRKHDRWGHQTFCRQRVRDAPWVFTSAFR
jgi:hypothetical protein